MSGYGNEEVGTADTYQRVLIRKAGYSKPFYGILQFSKVHSSADSLALRRWRVVIPEQYFEAAKGGGVSIVYEPYSYKSNQQYYNSYAAAYKYHLVKSSTQAASWVLWMSDIPL